MSEPVQNASRAGIFIREVIRSWKEVKDMVSKKPHPFGVLAVAIGLLSWGGAYLHYGTLITERDVAIEEKDKEIFRLQPANYNNLLKEQTMDVVESIRDIIGSVENRAIPDDKIASKVNVRGREVFFSEKEIQRWDKLKIRALLQREKLIARLSVEQHNKKAEPFYAAPLNLDVLHSIADDLTLLAGRL